jgi:hypothetical protein
MVKVSGRVALILFIAFAAVFAYFWQDISSTFKDSTCPNLESGFYTLRDSSNYCAEDSDCIVIDTGCQLGCFALVNTNSSMNQLLALSTQFVKAGCGVCNKACIAPPKQEAVICSSGKCVIKEEP